MKPVKKYLPKSRLRAKLSFDEGFAERPIYVIKAHAGEKEKGINMLELIETNFNICDQDRIEAVKKKLKELNEEAMTPTVLPKDLRDKQVKFTKDEEGNIVSPFRSKKKLS